jgi:hypothetical protein
VPNESENVTRENEPKKPMLKFAQEPEAPGKVTKDWYVGTDDSALGWIKWYSPWRRYVFYPRADTLFDSACLIEIAAFCCEQTKQRKREWKKSAPRATYTSEEDVKIHFDCAPF